MKTDQELISLLSATIGMQDFSTSINLCHLLMLCRDVLGDVVELGCNRGDTAKLLTAITSKQVVLFDSFEGLPEPTKADDGRREDFQKGNLKCSALEVMLNFDKDQLPRPEIVNGWFNNVSQFEMPEAIAFAHIDADLFQSMMDALMLVYPKLSRGAICVIHDYGWPGLPGVKEAVDEFMADKPEKPALLPAITGIASKQAYFKKH